MARILVGFLEMEGRKWWSSLSRFFKQYLDLAGNQFYTWMECNLCGILQAQIGCWHFRDNGKTAFGLGYRKNIGVVLIIKLLEEQLNNPKGLPLSRVAGLGPEGIIFYHSLLNLSGSRLSNIHKSLFLRFAL